jgi:hypothetical protein
MHLLNRRPQRVAAVWARSQALIEMQPAARAVPVMLNYGVGEQVGKFEAVHRNSLASFNKHRPRRGRCGRWRWTRSPRTIAASRAA